MKNIQMKNHDCNKCARSCRGDVIRERNGNVKQWLVCPGQILPLCMRTTLTERASENDGSINALGKLLHEFGLQFDPIPNYPYFRLILANKQEVL
jgi:hypothetical protein